MRRLPRFLKDRLGAELVEYAIAVALLILIAIIVYSALGASVNDSAASTGSTVKEAPQDPFGGQKGCPNPPCGKPPCDKPPCGKGGDK